MSPGRLAGKVILVTGAARGQGAAEVAAIAAEGGAPIATDVDAGGDVLALDVSRAADWARAAEVARAGTVDDIAPLVVFLLSDESAYITGVEIPVDGGTSGHAGAKFLRDAARRGQA